MIKQNVRMGHLMTTELNTCLVLLLIFLCYLLSNIEKKLFAHIIGPLGLKVKGMNGIMPYNSVVAGHGMLTPCRCKYY